MFIQHLFIFISILRRYYTTYIQYNTILFLYDFLVYHHFFVYLFLLQYFFQFFSIVHRHILVLQTFCFLFYLLCLSIQSNFYNYLFLCLFSYFFFKNILFMYFSFTNCFLNVVLILIYLLFHFKINYFAFLLYCKFYIYLSVRLSTRLSVDFYLRSLNVIKFDYLRKYKKKQFKI